MLIAHVEASGVWRVDGGMHRIALALEALASAHGATFRYGAPVARSWSGGAGRSRGARAGRAHRRAPRSSSTPIRRRWRRAASARLRRAPCRMLPVRERSLSAVTLDAGRRDRRAFRSITTMSSSATTMPPSSPTCGAGRLPAVPSVYVCAEDRDATRAAVQRPERLHMIVNAPAIGDGLTRGGDRAMRGGDVRDAGALRAEGGADPGGDGADDAGATSRRCFRRRAARCTDGRRTAGGRRFQRPGATTRIPGLYCAGGATHPGAGVPMAALSGRLAAAAWRATACSIRATRPAFDGAVAPGGYRWWYIDAFSDDGQHGLTIIAFIGSVFSPYYKLERARATRQSRRDQRRAVRAAAASAGR